MTPMNNITTNIITPITSEYSDYYAITHSEPRCQGRIAFHDTIPSYIACPKPASEFIICWDCYFKEGYVNVNCDCINKKTHIICSDCARDYIAWKYAYDQGLHDAEEHETVLVDYDDEGPIYDEYYKTKDGRIIGADKLAHSRYFILGPRSHKIEEGRWSLLD